MVQIETVIWLRTITGTEMENDYRERWCQFLASAMTQYKSFYGNFPAMAKYADDALAELKKRDADKFFDQPDKGYRK